MPEFKVVKETAVSMKELKEALEKIKKRDTELNFRANKTEEYLNQFVTGKKNDIEEVLAKLNIPRLKEQHIKKIVDMMPKTVEELKTIIQAYPITVTNENLKKIAETVAKYL